MTLKHTLYKGSVDTLPYSKIYINVKHLKKGLYELNITNKNKLIKTTRFKK